MRVSYVEFNFQVAALPDTERALYDAIVGRIDADADAWIKDPERIRICEEKLGRKPMKRSDPFFIKDATLACHVLLQRFDLELDFDDVYRGVQLVYKRPRRTITSFMGTAGSDENYDIWQFKVDSMLKLVKKNMATYEQNLRALRNYEKTQYMCNENFMEAPAVPRQYRTLAGDV